MKIHYLEIVTPDVDAVCSAYEAALAAKFSEADSRLGGARSATLPDGSTVGVRGPLRADEAPIIRPYWRVDDLAAAVDAAERNGAMIALRSMDIPGKGRIAIYIHGGVDHGLWQSVD